MQKIYSKNSVMIGQELLPDFVEQAKEVGIIVEQTDEDIILTSRSKVLMDLFESNWEDFWDEYVDELDDDEDCCD